MASINVLTPVDVDKLTQSAGSRPQSASTSTSHSFGQVYSLPRSSKSRQPSLSFNLTCDIPSAAPVMASNGSEPTCRPPSISNNKYSLAHNWRELQGSNNWENLLSPLDPLLCREIIRYGELVTGCYKAFDLDPNSKRYLNCKYGKANMFKEIGMENSGYQVTKYIYATPQININIPTIHSCGRWVGYVAVSTDDSVRKLGRRDILITFRGTVTNPEWVANFMSSLVPARLDPYNPRPELKVESGFLSLYTSDESDQSKFGLGSCREQLLSEVSRLINKYKDEEVSISLAGHSMGSSLALLLSYDIAELGLNKIYGLQNNSIDTEIPITVFSFGGPRVGNLAFKQRCEELGVKVLRIVNVNDPITKLPGVLFNENFRVFGGRYELPWSCACYTHVGSELLLDFFDMQNPSCVHDLEAYIINLLKSLKNKITTKPQKSQKDGGNFLSKARDQLTLSAQYLNVLPWQTNAISNMMMIFFLEYYMYIHTIII